METLLSPMPNLKGLIAHAHQVLARPLPEGARRPEPGGGVDLIAPRDLARIRVACKQTTMSGSRCV